MAVLYQGYVIIMKRECLTVYRAVNDPLGPCGF